MKKFKRIVSLGLILSLSFSCLGETDVRAKDKKSIGTVGIIDDFGEHSTGDDDYDTPSPVSTVRPTYVPTYTPLPVHTYTPVVYTPEPTEEPEFEEEVDRDPFDLKSEPCEDEEPELKVRKFRFKRPDKNYYTYYDRMQWEKKHLNVNLPKYDAKHGAVKEVTPKIKYKTINYKKGMKSVTVKMEAGMIMALRIKGAKKVKYDDLYEFRMENGKGGYKCYPCIKSSNELIERSYHVTVNGNPLLIKVKPIASKYKKCKDYKNSNMVSKWSWKSIMPCVGYYGASDPSDKIMKLDAKSYKECDTYDRYPKGRSKYCEWEPVVTSGWAGSEFRVQGYPVSIGIYIHRHTARKYKRISYVVDKVIDMYHIPSASKMSKEECCKWIRRNGRVLRLLYGYGNNYTPENSALDIAIAPIFSKASDYNITDRYTPNSLVFKLAYNSEKNGLKYRYFKDDLDFNSFKGEDGKGYLVKGYTVKTWVGAIYSYLNCHYSCHKYKNVSMWFVKGSHM